MYHVTHKALKVSLLSAPMSSEVPFCTAALLRKHLISALLFGRSKIGKRYVVLHSLGNTIKRYVNRNVSVKAGFSNYFSRLFVNFRKVYLFPRLLENIF